MPKAEIAENDYNLSFNRYSDDVYEDVEHDPPRVILDRREIEEELTRQRTALEGMLK